MNSRRKRGRPAVISLSERKRRKVAYRTERQRSKIYIGAEIERWNALKGKENLRFDHEVARFLLDMLNITVICHDEGNNSVTFVVNIFYIFVYSLHLTVIGIILFGLLISSLLIISQISLVLLLGRGTAAGKAWYAAVLLVNIIPEIIYLLRNVWTASFFANHRYTNWPNFRNLSAGVFLSLVEPGSIFFLSSVIFSHLPGHVLLPSLNVSIIPKLSSTHFPKKHSSSFSRIYLVNVVSCLVMICCAIVVSINLYSRDIVLHYQAAVLPILLVTSVLSFQTPIRNYIYGHTEASTNNAAILYTFIRIAIHIILTTKIISYEETDSASLNMNGLIKAFQELSNDKTIFTLIAVHAVTSFLSQVVMVIPRGSKRMIIMTSVPIALAQLLSPIGVLFLCVFKPALFLGLVTPLNCELNWNQTGIILYAMCLVLVVVSIVVVFIPLCYLSTNNKITVNTQITQYSSVFLLQNLIINLDLLQYRNPHTFENINLPHTKRTRVFICTTMYQEAEHEMQRLLKSLNKVALSKKLQDNDIFLESHIFLDNGANGKEMKDFGKQLLSLVEENFELRQESGLLLYTPYGIQLHWELECGTSVFIHLKDKSKVKAKKRWSQVMYLKYILNYKARNFGSTAYDLKNSESFSTYFYSSNQSLDKLSDDESIRDRNEDRNNSNPDKDVKNQTQLHVPKAKFKVGPKTPSYGSLESLEGIQDIPDPVNLHVSNDSVDLPDIVLYPSCDEGDGDYDFTEDARGDVSSNDGSLVTGDVHIRSRELLVSQLPTEIHTQDNTIFSVSVSRSETLSIPTNTNNYILMTDADMSFDEDSVLNVINTCNEQPEVGGVCGRTFPIGIHIHPIIWLQMFDYAKDFWMIKSSQNIIGSVMCCPGCFSLFRFEALEDVFDTYSRPTESVEDVFTKDNGEDRWMCTLMMLHGWKLRYVQSGRNSTFCPEETTEFMKQRRRWLLSDYANAFVVMRNLLFIIMVLYPGSTIMMLSLGLELASGIPLIVVTPVFSLIVLGYALLLLSDQVSSTVQLTLSKILVLLLGLGTCYIFIATAIIIFNDLKEDYRNGTVTHVEQVILLALAATYLLAGILHPREIWILVCGVPYTFYLPFLNIILPVYAICNIVDQSWGTRDNQVAKVPKIFSLPHIKRRKHKKPKTNLSKDKDGSFTSLNSSTLDLRDFNEDEMSFWTRVVDEIIGIKVKGGMTAEEREVGLRKLRKKVVIIFCIANGLWIASLCICYAFLLQLMDNKTTFSIIILASLGLSPLIQVTGMVIVRCRELFASLFTWLLSEE